MNRAVPTSSVRISVLIPVFNEVESLEQLYELVTEICEGTGLSHEIVFVNDGSTDGSGEHLDGLTSQDPRVSVIHFRRNFGKSPALAAGFEQVTGDVVVTMDADLQDDPRMIPQFVERIHAGADLVSGWKKVRHDPPAKTVPSRLFNGVVRSLSGVPLHDFNCGFKAYRLDCVRELNVYGGLHRFLPVLASERGYRIEELVVEHHPRRHGISKFGTKRFVDGFLDLLTVLLLTRYRMRPLHFFGIPGAIAGLFGTGILTYLTLLWCLGEGIGGRPLLILGVLLTLTSFQFLGIGLLAELMVRTTVQPREIFSIRDIRRAAPEPRKSTVPPPPPPPPHSSRTSSI